MKYKIYIITVINEERWIGCQKVAFSAESAKQIYKEMKKEFIDPNVMYGWHIEAMEFDNTSSEGRPFSAWMK